MGYMPYLEVLSCFMEVYLLLIDNTQSWPFISLLKMAEALCFLRVLSRGVVLQTSDGNQLKNQAEYIKALTLLLILLIYRHVYITAVRDGELGENMCTHRRVV